MKYTNHEDATNFMVTAAAEKGMFSNEQIDQLANEIVEGIPAATKAMYAPADLLGDNYVLAANYYEVYQGTAGNSANPANTAMQTSGVTGLKTGRASFTPSPSLSDEQLAAAQALLSGNSEAKAMKTQQTKIKQILVRAPKASELIGGKTIVPECDPEKLVEYEGQLVDTPENKAAFARIKEAVNSKAKMPVFINDESRKYMGVVVATPISQEGKTVLAELTFDEEGLVNFVALELFCRIPSQGTGLGCIISGFRPLKAAKKADLTQQQGRAVLKWDGKTEAIKKGDPNIVVAINEKKGKEVKDGKLRIADSFRIYATSKDGAGNVTFKTNKKGEKITKVVRLTGTSKEIPLLVRKSAFVSLFGEEKNGNVIFATLTKQDQMAALQTALQFVDMVSSSSSAMGTGNTELDSILKTIKDHSGSSKPAEFAE